jgi:hypothetical protein
MNKKSSAVLVIIASLIAIMLPVETIAEPQSTTITPINEKISIKKTILTMNVPENNMLPWGIVKGNTSDVVENYPIIIQFYKSDKAIHFAQVDVNGDGSFEYKFRVRNVDNTTGEVENIFDGQYMVKIFRVVHNQNETV